MPVQVTHSDYPWLVKITNFSPTRSFQDMVSDWLTANIPRDQYVWQSMALSVVELRFKTEEGAMLVQLSFK